MSEFLYTVFIFPIEYLIQMVIEAVLESTASPILSLISASAFVSIGSIPLYHMAEKWQDHERAIQAKLSPKLKEFKSVFKGANLNAYIQTLYRQNGYHPIFAIRSVFGILIQIPFFFAAYHLLSGYSAFDGVSAFIFDDLGSPDGLIKIGDLNINLFPFLMTAVNVFSAVIYSKKLGKKEKIQIYGIAGVFLVALYASPASLLFYWTLNNVFSLVKNGVYRLIYPDGRIRTAQSESADVSAFWLRVTKLKPGVWGQITLFVFSAEFYLLASELIKKGSSNAFGVYGLLFSVLFTLGVFTVAGVFTNKSLHSKTRVFWAIMYGVVLLLALIFQMIWMIGAVKSHLNPQFACSMLLGLVAFEWGRAKVVMLSNWIEKKGLVITSRPGTLFALAVLTLLITVFVFTPLLVVSSASVGEFNQSLSHYLFFMIALAVSAFIFMGVIYSYLSRPYQSLFTYLISIAAILSLVNAFVFTGDYGEITNFQFESGLNTDPLMMVVNVLVLPAVAAGLIFLFIRKKYAWLVPVFSICLLSIGVVAASEGHQFYRNRKKITQKLKQASAFNKEFVFSKTQKNVLVIMLDRFIGGFVPKCLELAPELKKQFEGFTWYPRYLSEGAYTTVGVPSLMGGWEYHLKELHEKRKHMRLKDKLDESARVLPYNFAKAGYKTTLFANLDKWFNAKDKTYVEKTHYESLEGKYTEQWLKMKNETLEKENIRGKLAMLGVFRTAPPFLRKSIYDDGDWLLSSSIGKKKQSRKAIIGKKQVSYLTTSKAAVNSAVNCFSTLDLLPQLSKSSKKAPKQFYYFSNKFTHEVGVANSDFGLSIHERIYHPRDVYDEFDKDMRTLKHLYNDAAAMVALGKWFEWMKKNGVYDNTRIIVVSDHGRHVHDPLFKSQRIRVSKKKKKLRASWFHGVFMVKDFGEKGDLDKNDRFIAASDVPAITMKGVVHNPINPTSKKKIAEKKNKFPFYIYSTHPLMRQQTKYNYVLKDAYKIMREQDVMDPRKWKSVNVK